MKNNDKLFDITEYNSILNAITSDANSIDIPEKLEPKNIGILLDRADKKNIMKKNLEPNRFLQIASFILILCIAGTVTSKVIKLNGDNLSFNGSSSKSSISEPCPTRQGESSIEIGICENSTIGDSYNEDNYIEPDPDEYITQYKTSDNNLLLINSSTGYQYLLKPGKSIIEAYDDKIITSIDTKATDAFIYNNILVLVKFDGFNNTTNIQCYNILSPNFTKLIYDKTFNGIYRQHTRKDEKYAILYNESIDQCIKLPLNRKSLENDNS